MMAPTIRHLPNVVLGRVFASYPFERGYWFFRRMLSSWLITQIDGIYMRCSGVVEAEWQFLRGIRKEPRTTSFINDFLQPGMTFVDVGANVGYFALLAARKVGPRGIVVAYEPTGEVAQRLRENVALNGFTSVRIVQCAISDNPGMATFYRTAGDYETNSLYADERSTDSEQVRVTTLDDDLRSLTRLDLLKIDAEGAEPAVLDGARLTIARFHPVIIIESNRDKLRDAGSSAERLQQQIADMGYELRVLEHLVEITDNLVALPTTHRTDIAGFHSN